MTMLNFANSCGLLQSDMDKLVRAMLSRPYPGERQAVARGYNRVSYPALNVWENESAYFVEAELPGASIDDIDVHVTGQELSLKGKLTQQNQQQVIYHRRERELREFNRIVQLPVAVDGNSVEATLKDGILTIRLAKAESARPRKISVRG